RSTVSSRNIELGDSAGERQPADSVDSGLGEPEVAIGPGGNSQEVEVGPDGELGYVTRGCDSSDLAGVNFRKPEVSIRPDSNLPRRTVRRGDSEPCDHTGRSHAEDFVLTQVGDPEVIVRAGG